MIAIKARCLIKGPSFSPALAGKTGGIVFRDMNEPGALGEAGRYRGNPIPYGSATLESANQELDGLLEILDRSMDKLLEAGANDFILHCDVLYQNQCNFEFSIEQIALVARLKLPLTISCSGKEALAVNERTN